MRKVKFKERQRYKDRVAFVLLGAGIVCCLYGVFISMTVEPIQLMQALFFGLTALAIGGYWWWLHQLELKWSITDKGIKFRMEPLQDKARKIPWEEVVSCRVYKTPQAALWHGGNLHFGTELWYSLSGRNGLSIQTKDGRQYFLGSRKVDQLADFVASRL